MPHASYCSAQPGAMREDAIRIAISRDGRIYLNRSAVRLEKLPKLIREEVSAGSERKVYISVDSRASNSDAESVLDQIRSAGITASLSSPIAQGNEPVSSIIPKLPHPSAVSPATHVMIEQT